MMPSTRLRNTFGIDSNRFATVICHTDCNVKGLGLHPKDLVVMLMSIKQNNPCKVTNSENAVECNKRLSFVGSEKCEPQGISKNEPSSRKVIYDWQTRGCCARRERCFKHRSSAGFLGCQGLGMKTLGTI